MILWRPQLLCEPEDGLDPGIALVIEALARRQYALDYPAPPRPQLQAFDDDDQDDRAA